LAGLVAFNSVFYPGIPFLFELAIAVASLAFTAPVMAAAAAEACPPDEKLLK